MTHDLNLMLVGLGAGLIGSLSGLGGGTILTPILTLFFHVPIEYAAGTSLMATIATSSGAAAAYIKDRLTNLKIGTSLEIATTSGAIAGAYLATLIYSHHMHQWMFLTFGVILLLSLIPSALNLDQQSLQMHAPDATTRFFQLEGSYYDHALQKEVRYVGVRWWLAEMIMLVAGLVSGLLGIGSGALKVLGMDWAMRLPIKVSTATSNFMIGVTAAAGVGAYWAAGYVQPALIAPTILGVMAGSIIGTKILNRLHGRKVRLVFLAVVFVLAIEMIGRSYGQF